MDIWDLGWAYITSNVPTVAEFRLLPPVKHHCDGCDRLRRLLSQESHRVAKLTAECDALIKRVKELEGQR